MHSQTSTTESVRIEVAPKSVVHTSPEILDEAENTFMSR